jgi:hypothetical protein
MRDLSLGNLRTFYSDTPKSTRPADLARHAKDNKGKEFYGTRTDAAAPFGFEPKINPSRNWLPTDSSGVITNEKSKQALNKIMSRDPRNERIWDIVQNHSENELLKKVMRYMRKYMISESFIRKLRQELGIIN